MITNLFLGLLLLLGQAAGGQEPVACITPQAVHGPAVRCWSGDWEEVQPGLFLISPNYDLPVTGIAVRWAEGGELVVRLD